MSNCLVEASFQSAEANCSCVPGNLKISASQCHGPGLLCFRNVMNMIGEQRWVQRFCNIFFIKGWNNIILSNGVKKPCLNPCRGMRYSVDTSHSYFPIPTTFKRCFIFTNLILFGRMFKCQVRVILQNCQEDWEIVRGPDHEDAGAELPQHLQTGQHGPGQQVVRGHIQHS